MGRDELWKLIRMAVERSAEESGRPGSAASHQLSKDDSTPASQKQPLPGIPVSIGLSPQQPIKGTKRHPPRLVVVNLAGGLAQQLQLLQIGAANRHDEGSVFVELPEQSVRNCGGSGSHNDSFEGR